MHHHCHKANKNALIVLMAGLFKTIIVQCEQFGKAPKSSNHLHWQIYKSISNQHQLIHNLIFFSSSIEKHFSESKEAHQKNVAETSQHKQSHPSFYRSTPDFPQKACALYLPPTQSIHNYEQMLYKNVSGQPKASILGHFYLPTTKMRVNKHFYLLSISKSYGKSSFTPSKPFFSSFFMCCAPLNHKYL